MPELNIDGCRGFTGLEQARILADDLFRGVTRGFDKSGINVFDQALFVGDGDRNGTLFNDSREFFHQFLRFFLFGDIANRGDDLAVVAGVEKT